ncbi:MAG: glycerophosphodiester phosphodiesterase [Candidatus Hodarchaeota archaeon]
MSTPWIIAHRGASGICPENTMEAFWTAIVAGADIIEFDLQLTADNEIVVFHDRTVDRVFNRKLGNTIKDYALKGLQEQDVGSWFDPAYSWVRIPTLHEVLEKLPKETSMIIELKSPDPRLGTDLLNMLDDTKKSLGTGYISVRDVTTYNSVRDASSQHRLGLMQKQRAPIELLNLLEEEGIQIVQVRWQHWQNSEWIKLKESKALITAYYADYPSEYDFLCQKEIDGILTNYPSRLASYLIQSKHENK